MSPARKTPAGSASDEEQAEPEVRRPARGELRDAGDAGSAQHGHRNQLPHLYLRRHAGRRGGRGRDLYLLRLTRRGARGRCPRAPHSFPGGDPMKKLALEIADLRVDSFGTVAEPNTLRGTVAAAEATARCTVRDCTCTC